MPRARRNWKLVNEKFLREHGCRVCGLDLSLCDRAHILGREWDNRLTGIVNPDDIVPLCNIFTARKHHDAYDNHQLDLVPYLRSREIARAVELVGPGQAARRLRSSREPAELPMGR